MSDWRHKFLHELIYCPCDNVLITPQCPADAWLTGDTFWFLLFSCLSPCSCHWREHSCRHLLIRHVCPRGAGVTHKQYSKWSMLKAGRRCSHTVRAPQMALSEIQGNGESSYVSEDAVNTAIQLLEDTLQRVSKAETLCQRLSTWCQTGGLRPRTGPWKTMEICQALFWKYCMHSTGSL